MILNPIQFYRDGNNCNVNNQRSRTFPANNMLYPRIKNFEMLHPIRITSRYFLILSISSALISMADSLSGEHVCTKVENVTLSRKETYEEPFVVQTFTWCLKVPPRCPRTRIEIRERYRIKTIVEQRIVSECCEGYIIEVSSPDVESKIPKCVPFCKIPCENGICTAPNVCLCDQGFQGSNCAHAQLEESKSVEEILKVNLTDKPPDLYTTVQFSKYEETTEGNIDYNESWTSGVRSENRTTEQHVEKESTTLDEVSEETKAKNEYPTTMASFEHELTPFEEMIRTTSEKTLPNEITDEKLDYRNYVNEKESRDSSSTIPAPQQRSFVKNVQKGNDAQIQNDMTIFIVVGCIASLCLTTMVVLMVFYLRCKLFDSIPISIYSTGKNDPKEDRGTDTIRNLKITNTTLPPLPTFVNPVFNGSQETALITFDAAELNKHYDNGTATISIRVSGNIRDLLESHYDRPPPTATICRHTVDHNTEHVYDEIPLTAPLCVRKES